MSSPVAPDVSHSSRRKAARLLWSALFLLTAGLLVYSQTMSFVWDEGFHILAAQLIDKGKTPYLDFCFPQTPLNTYWNAIWLQLFGQSWRVTHIWAALFCAGGTALMAEFLLTHFPIRRWQLAAAMITAIFVALNSTVVEFGTVAQAYGIGLFLTVAAFRFTVAAAFRNGWLWVFAAGLFAGLAAACTLLTAPVAPVLLAWILVYHQFGNRRRNLLAFCAGAIVPFAPVLYLFAKAPRVVFFNIVQYQAIFRRVNWEGATTHDVDVLSAWLNDSQSLFLGLLALAGIWFVARRSHWDRPLRAQFYLCAWLTGGLVLYISTAHPTFTRYFVFATPFAAALAAVGSYEVATRFGRRERPLIPALLLTVLIALSLARDLFDDRDSTTWYDYQDIARKVDQVTPPNGRLYADELVYFLLQRTPPPGMEFSYAHKIELPPAQEALYHIVSDRELMAQVKAGKFDTLQTCKDDKTDEVDDLHVFPHKIDVRDCTIFWSKGRAMSPPGVPNK